MTAEYYVGFLLLALIQALTEFLPVSSSGHLVLAQHLLGYTQETDFTYDILLHVATVISIIVYFRRDIRELIAGTFKPNSVSEGIFAGTERKAIAFFLITLIPTGMIGFCVKEYFMHTALNPSFVGLMLIVTGVLLWSGRGKDAQRGMREMNMKDALVLGLVQGLAVLPGISRSGATITCALLLGLKREVAARFSLLMSVPAILGISAVSLFKAIRDGDKLPPAGPAVIGMIAAAIVGYFAIAIIIKMVRRKKFHYFAWYVWLLGLLALSLHALSSPHS